MPEVIRISHSERIVPTSDFPYASWSFAEFNPIQSTIVDQKLYETESNIAIAAATSCGKTIMGELFMSHEVRKNHGKALYVGPLKALAKEKENDWTDEKHHFKDLNISICTGDFRLTQKRVDELDQADVIVMTPEMLASRCRNQESEKSHFLSQVGVIVFDESHLLTVPNRGDHIEVALMKMVEINPKIRIVFLSATMPNVDEICRWLSELTKRDTYYLESDYRPCPLHIHYECYYDGEKSYDAVELQKVGTALGIIEHYCDDKFLVFVHSKKAGKKVLEQLRRHKIESDFHNADLALATRLKLENRFRTDPKLRVLVSTSTLAWGCYAHGSKLLLPNGSLKSVESISVGDSLLCPVKNEFKPRSVVRVKDFESEISYFVKLESGEEMVVSKDHVFFGANHRNSPDWVGVLDLKPGDFVAIPSDLGLFDKTSEFNRFWYFIGFAFGDGCLCDVGLHADGSRKALLDLCLGKNDPHAEWLVKNFNQEFDTQLCSTTDSNGVEHLVTKTKSVVDMYLKYLPLGRKDGNHDIPLELYGDQNRITNFLRGWFDADGGMENHSNDNWSVGLSCISKDAIESARALLLGFGIRSSFGKKRMKDTCINGRLQKAKRKWSYRLRIFGHHNISVFADKIGFTHNDKNRKLQDYLASIDKSKSTKDLLPARGLLREHLKVNGLKGSDLRKICNIDLWNSCYLQDCKRETIQKLLDQTNIKTPLNNLMDLPIYWSRVKQINQRKIATFREIEVEDPHAYIGNGVISHNCNLPARRVIILGVHRGLTEVENYDIQQMIGRSGRPAYDPQGDAYILIPERTQKETIAKLRKPTKITSQLLAYVGTEDKPHYKTLAFHLVSEIYSGSITTKEGFHDWFKKSLAHHQNHSFDDALIDKVIDQLVNCYAITLEDGQYKATNIGKIASIFYYSPFDVSDLRRNFKQIFENKLEKDDHAIALALGNVDSYRWGITSRDERENMATFTSLVKHKFGEKFYTESSLKYAYAYHNMLLGKYNVESFSAIQSTLRADCDRMMQVLKAIDSMSARWGKQDYLKLLQQRLTYGVQEYLLDLCQIPDVGKARAERLWNAGVKTLKDFTQCDSVYLSKVMKVTQQAAGESLNAAKGLVNKKLVEE